MPFDGSGNFTRLMNWVNDATANIKIKADRHDTEDNNFASGLSNVITKDGQTQPTADIPLNAKKIVNLGAPINPTDAATKGYVDGVRNFSSPIIITGSHPNAQLKFTGTTGPWGDSYVTADLAAGARGTDWVWNDKADFSGNDVMTLQEAGQVTLKSVGGNATLFLDGLGASDLQGRRLVGGVPKTRWLLRLGDGGTESGGNAGSVFAIGAYADDGATSLGAYFTITRVDGSVGIGGAGGVFNVAPGTVQFTNPGFQYHYHGSAHVAYVKKTGGYAFYWRRNDTGLNGGANNADLMSLSDGGYLSLVGGVGANGVTSNTGRIISLMPAAGDQPAISMYSQARSTAMGMWNAASTNQIEFGACGGGGEPISMWASLNSAGDFRASSSLITNSGYVYSGVAALYLACWGPGFIAFRPSGPFSAAGEATLSSGGLLTISSLNYGTFSTTGASAGGYFYSTGEFYKSTTVVSSNGALRFYNPNGLVGNITTINSATQYNTSSDENLKTLKGEYDPAEAIAIIRADPVLGFTWKVDGREAVGWFAQKSYAVNEDLASPPSPTANEDGTLTDTRDIKPGEDGYVPWGIDYGRRTPYLWAALTNVLDRLEALEAKLSITDPKPPAKEAA